MWYVISNSIDDIDSLAEGVRFPRHLYIYFNEGGVPPTAGELTFGSTRV